MPYWIAKVEFEGAFFVGFVVKTVNFYEVYDHL